MRKTRKCLLLKENGSVSITVALFMVVLIGIAGFAIDSGIYLSEGAKLQNALDSAVLAAAQELPASDLTAEAWSMAESEAISYASLNGFEIAADELSPIYKDDNPSEGIIGIKASKTISVEYSFAKVLGLDTHELTRSSTAGLSAAGGVRGVVPLCISSIGLESAIAAGAVTGLIIKCSSDSDLIGIDTSTASGWFGAVRIDGTGASTYSFLLANGYEGVLNVGQVLDMETGNMSGPTLDGFTERVSRCTDGCTAESYLPGCPRLVYVPVIEVLAGKQVKVVAFAAFFLLECGGSGNDSYIKATYIKDVTVSDSAAGKSGLDFGVYLAQLRRQQQAMAETFSQNQQLLFDEKEQLKKANEVLKAKLDAKDAEYSELHAEIKIYEIENEDVSSDELPTLKTKQAEHESEINELKNENSLLIKRLELRDNCVEEQAAELELAKQELLSLKELIKSQAQKERSQSAEIDKLKCEIETKNEEIVFLQACLAEGEMADLRAKVAELTEELSMQLEILEKVNCEIELKTKTIDVLTFENEALEQKTEELEKEASDLGAQKTKLFAETEALTAQLELEYKRSLTLIKERSSETLDRLNTQRMLDKANAKLAMHELNLG